VFLPIHQDITARHLRVIVDAVSQVLQEHRSREPLVVGSAAFLNDSAKPASIR
jgi:hypothetical protein